MKQVRRMGIFCMELVLAAVLATAIPAGSSGYQKFDPDRFIDPETCGGCHYGIMAQWQHSLHNLSHQDPVYSRVAAFLRKGLTDKDEIAEAESCVKCHTPLGYVTGFPKKLSDDLSKTSETAAQGIQCDYCHSAVRVNRMYNNGLVLSPGQGEDEPGVKYGPFDDSEPDYHEAAWSTLHGSSEICGTCHNVKHVTFGTDLETTYTEWQNSPYNSENPEERITCQGCHMYQRPGVPATGSTERPANPGAATDYSPERPHLFTHYFVGGNTHVPAVLSGAEDKAQMARERLGNAAAVALDLTGLKDKKLGILVTNTGAGHSIPTGVGDLRQVWLEVTISDRAGKILYQSGIPDKNHELPEDTRVFRTVFGDGKGNPVVNLAKAKEVLTDNRIPAKTEVRETIDLASVPGENSRIRVRLLYRGMSQKLLNQLPAPKMGPLPVVEMATAEQQVPAGG